MAQVGGTARQFLFVAELEASGSACTADQLQAKPWQGLSVSMSIIFLPLWIEIQSGVETSESSLDLLQIT